MKPRPLKRSLTFWSGILVMFFTVWAWVDSNMMESRVSRGRFAAFHNYGVIRFQKTNHPGPTAAQRGPNPESWPLFLPLIFCRGGTAPEGNVAHVEEASFEKQLRNYMSTEPSDTWIMVIPHWLIILAVTLPWSGMLLWRAKRSRPL